MRSTVRRDEEDRVHPPAAAAIPARQQQRRRGRIRLRLLLLAHARRIEDEQPKITAPKHRSCRRSIGPRAARHNACEVARQRIQSCPTSGDGRWCGAQNSAGEKREGHADEPASMLHNFDATWACKAFDESTGTARLGIEPQCNSRSEKKCNGNVASFVHRECCDACDCEAQHCAKSGRHPRRKLGQNGVHDLRPQPNAFCADGWGCGHSFSKKLPS